MAATGATDIYTGVANPAGHGAINTASASARERVVNPPGGPAKATADTGTRINVMFHIRNMLEVKPGVYPVYLSGWRWLTKSSNIRDNRIGLIVKASDDDHNKEPWEQRPPRNTYGHTEEGCQPDLVCCPITGVTDANPEDYFTGVTDLKERCRRVMQQDRAIVFHCDTGRTRAPCILAMWISYFARFFYTHPLDAMMEYIIPARKVNEYFSRLHKSVNWSLVLIHIEQSQPSPDISEDSDDSLFKPKPKDQSRRFVKGHVSPLLCVTPLPAQRPHASSGSERLVNPVEPPAKKPSLVLHADVKLAGPPAKTQTAANKPPPALRADVNPSGPSAKKPPPSLKKTSASGTVK